MVTNNSGMRLVFILLFILHTVGLAWGQGQGNVWHFGNKIGLDFSSGEPVEITDSEIVTYEGCASMSDCEGNLLFYTNGGGRLPGYGNSGMIWNRNNEVMYDMQGTEGGSWGSGQSSVIVKKPGLNNAYYLFTMEETQFNVDGNIPGQPFGRGLSLFEIDMNLNGGLGGVTIADQRVYVPSYENLTACLHNNEEDYWLVISTANAEFAVFEVTENGVVDTTFYPAPNLNTFGAANFKFSPDRTKLYAGGYLFDFNASTGEISNGEFMNAGTYGASFSANSRYLYTNSSTLSEIIRYDTEAADISASATQVGFLNSSYPLIGAFQLAPDQNIYVIVTTIMSDVELFQIKDPDGMTPSVEGPLFSWDNQGQGAFGLPNFTDHIFLLEEQPITLPANLNETEFVLCPGETLVFDAENDGAIYQWSNGETAQAIEVNTPGLYTVDISNGCTILTGIINVVSPQNLDAEIIASKEQFCPDEEVSLELFTSFEGNPQIVWNTGETDMVRISTTEPGEYTVTIQNECGETLTASIEIFLVDSAPDLTLESTAYEMCPGDDIKIDAWSDTALDVYWEMDTENTEMAVEEPGTYFAFAENACFTTEASLTILPSEDCENCLEIPNIFTPYQDRLNDTFRPLTNCPMDEYRLSIYNRWGQLVYQTMDPEDSWDGSYKGKPSPSDVYFYQVDIQFSYLDEEGKVEQGELILMR